MISRVQVNLLVIYFPGSGRPGCGTGPAMETSFFDAVNVSVDPKVVEKPGKLTAAARDAFSNWAFGFRPYVHMLHLFSPGQLRKVEACSQAISMEALSVNHQQKSYELLCVLVRFESYVPFLGLASRSLAPWRPSSRSASAH